MTSQKPFLLVIVLLIGALLAACSPAIAANPEPDPSAPSFDNTTWTLTGFGDGTVLVTGTDVTLTFGTDGSATGNASINHYNGTYTVNGETLTFSPFASTKMGGDPALMTQESAYLNALAQTASFHVDGSTLNLYDPAGILLLTYHSA